VKQQKQQRRFDHSGSTFDSFLQEEGLLQESEAVAMKRMIAWKLLEAMASARLTKKAMAERLRTSRAQVDRLLDPANVGVTLESVAQAAHALGKRISVQVVDSGRARNRRRNRKSAA
jgi:hypothetical protein